MYLVCEASTGVERTVKFFFPHRNKSGRSSRFYAKKLHKLRHCGILIQYHMQDNMMLKGEKVTYLVSEFIEGEQLSDFIKRHPGRRLHYFMALKLLYDICRGLEEIHNKGEYHGDLHTNNIIVSMRGLGFDVKLLDLQNSGKANATLRKEDILNLTQILYDMSGGKLNYSKSPQQVKDICCGLKNSLILKRFPTVRKLRKHLEEIDWD